MSPDRGVDDDAAFRRRVRQALDAGSPGVALARVEFDRIDRVAEYFGEGVAEFVQDELVLRLKACAADPAAVFCPPGGMALVLVPIASARADDLSSAAWELMEALSAGIDVGSGQVSIGCTVGIAEPGVLGDRSVAGLINAASAASRRASSLGSRRAAVFEGTHELTGRRGILDRSLFEALGTDQIVPWFHPRVRLADGVIVGAEAVARWNHPVYGTVSADEFVPEAQQSGLVRRIDQLVIDQAVRAAASWPGDAGIVVNVSTASLDDPAFVTRVTAALDAAGLPPERVTLEIAGAGQAWNRDLRRRRLEAAKHAGLRLSLGDLGGVHAYVDVLGDGLFDEFTIDRPLVRGWADGPDVGALTALVGFATSLSLGTVAVGLATPEELQAVVAAGCPVGQGDLLHPVVPGTDLPDLLAAFRYQG